MQEENLFAFFDPGFDDLPAVVVLEPFGQILRDRVDAVMKQSGVLERGAGVKTFDGNIQRIGAICEQSFRPGEHFGIGTYASVCTVSIDLLLKKVG